MRNQTAATRAWTPDERSLTRYHRGTHRLVPPETTWARVRPLLPVYGITRVADVTGLDRLDIPVFQAVRPDARTISVSQGKGVDPGAARVSAVMEAIELWYAEQIPDPPEHRSTPRERDLPYPLSALDLAPGSVLHPDLPLHWCAGTGLHTGRVTAVPVDLVRLDHIFAPYWQPPLFRTTSNGLASGNSLEEATVHALAELCERDSLAVLRLQPSHTWPYLDLTTVTDPDAATLVERFARDGTTVEVIVAPAPPLCFEARLRSPLHPVIYSGAGCHLDPAVALLRAMTEAAQSRLTGITGARDDLPELLYRATDAAPRAATPDGLTLSWQEITTDSRPGASGDLTTDLATLTAIVAGRTGYEPIRVVLSGPDDIAMVVPVVKVVAPGLRFDDRADVSRPAASS